MFFQWFPITFVLRRKKPRASFFNAYLFSGNDVLKSFRNLLQSGDVTFAKKLVEDLDILWASKGENVDLSKSSKDDFITGFIPDDIDCGSKCVLFVLILKKNIGDQNFPSGDQKIWFVFRCEGKILLPLFGDFFHMATEKKFKRQLAPA